MIQIAERIQWTVRDLEVLPQSEDTRYELIGGELFMTRAPHRKHQQVSGRIYSALDAWSETSGLGEAIPAPGIISSVVDNVIPDVVWVSKERLALIEDNAGHLTAFAWFYGSSQSLSINIQRFLELKPPLTLPRSNRQ